LLIDEPAVLGHEFGESLARTGDALAQRGWLDL
jgi:hypothetical protein